MPDNFLDADAILASTFIRNVELHESLGSTNDRAAELARDSQIDLPALIAARDQTAGRGRGTHSWHSAEGALTFSVLTEPIQLGIAQSSWPKLSLVTAVAVCDALAKELNPQSESSSLAAAGNPKSPHLAIKWPNDVMLDNAKVAGILIESPGGPAPAKSRLIIGVGINVNNSRNAAPCELRGRAASLCDVSARPHSLQRVLVQFLNQFQRRLDQLVRNDPQLASEWQQLCWLSNQEVCIHDGNRTIEGTCTGISEDGALLIKSGSATNRVYGGSLRPTA